MSILVIAEHEESAIKGATLNTVAAAVAIGGEVHLLVAGENCAGAGEAGAKVDGVAKVLVADSAEYAHGLAENLAPLVVALAENYEHVLASATTFSKNLMPRVAALLDGVLSDTTDRVRGPPVGASKVAYPAVTNPGQAP